MTSILQKGKLRAEGNLGACPRSHRDLNTNLRNSRVHPHYSVKQINTGSPLVHKRGDSSMGVYVGGEE